MGANGAAHEEVDRFRVGVDARRNAAANCKRRTMGTSFRVFVWSGLRAVDSHRRGGAEAHEAHGEGLGARGREPRERLLVVQRREVASQGVRRRVVLRGVERDVARASRRRGSSRRGRDDRGGDGATAADVGRRGREPRARRGVGPAGPRARGAELVRDRRGQGGVRALGARGERLGDAARARDVIPERPAAERRLGLANGVAKRARGELALRALRQGAVELRERGSARHRDRDRAREGVGEKTSRASRRHRTTTQTVVRRPNGSRGDDRPPRRAAS